MPWIKHLLAVDQVEARGDAAEALRMIEDLPVGPDGRPWWRPERVRRLRQLVALGDAAPPWVWARWVVAQAAQATPGDPQRAREVAIETRGGRRTLWGVDDVDAGAKVIDHDWVYRQLVLHEYGGLDRFLRTMAGPRLLERAHGVETWVGTPMGAYMLVDETADAITWLDLVSDRRVSTLNIGASSMVTWGECVIGRVVQSGGTTLFESPPLCVPFDVACQVGRDPSEWVSAVAEGCRGPFGSTLSTLVTKFHDFEMMSDLSTRVRRQLLQPMDPDLQPDEVGTGGNGLEYDTALVLAALAGEVDVAGVDEDFDDEAPDDEEHAGVPVAAFVAAALLEPGTVDALAPMLLPSDSAALEELAALLAEPAGEMCRRLAARIGQVA